MPPEFYSDRDREIFNQYQYVPQEKYLQRPFQFPTQEEEETSASGSGISTLPVYMGGAGGGAPADVTNLLFDFKGATDTRQNRIENPNPFAQKLYDFGLPQQRSVDQMMRDATAYNMAQLGPDFKQIGITSNMSKPEIDAAMAEYAADETSIGNYPVENPLDVRPQLPFGATGILQAVLPDSYYDKMTMPQQIYTQSKMGYTGPTVFGENTTGGSKDIFGRNIRSGFGNYAEKQQRDIDKLDDYFSSDLFQDRYGDTKLVQDEFGNYTFVNVNNPALAAKANQMNKMNLFRYNYDKQGLQELKDIEDQTGYTDILKANKKRTEEIQRQLDAGTYGRDDPPDRNLSDVTTESAAKTSGVGGGGYTQSDSAREDRRGGQYGFKEGGLAGILYG